jgi:SnoaL-like protein
MKMLLVGVAGCLAFFVSGSAAAADAQLMAPVHQFIDSFNKGDAKAAEAAHTASVSIIDEVPPHVWQGSGAFKAWAASLDKDAKARGITDQVVTLSDATREEMTGDRAYLVVPAVYSFKQKGAAMKEEAQMTFSLQKVGAGWKLTGWTWTGPKPSPAN